MPVPKAHRCRRFEAKGRICPLAPFEDWRYEGKDNPVKVRWQLSDQDRGASNARIPKAVSGTEAKQNQEGLKDARGTTIPVMTPKEVTKSVEKIDKITDIPIQTPSARSTGDKGRTLDSTPVTPKISTGGLPAPAPPVQQQPVKGLDNIATLESMLAELRELSSNVSGESARGSSATSIEGLATASELLRIIQTTAEFNQEEANRFEQQFRSSSGTNAFVHKISNAKYESPYRTSAGRYKAKIGKKHVSQKVPFNIGEQRRINSRRGGFGGMVFNANAELKRLAR